MPDPQSFAREWQAGWNARDLPRILSHYAPDVVFRSAKAIALTGSAVLIGKEALAAYWAAALAAQPDLRFEVTGVFAGPDMIVLTYRNHRDIHATETLHFGTDGLVIDGSACHGVA